MGEGETAPEEQTKKSRHRKKHLYNQILQQMEFYFSDSNLSKDRFLSQLTSESPFVDLQIFLKFNKIRKLNCTLDDIRKAISKSELIELSEDKEKVCRKKPVKKKENVEECTIYVENIKADATHEWLTQIFSDFGHVVYVSLPRYKHNRLIKGFAFIEYETEKGAKDALEFFNSIGCKMPSDKSPEDLQSIVTFDGNNEGKTNENEENKMQSQSVKKEEEFNTVDKADKSENVEINEKEKVETENENNVKKRKLSSAKEENEEKRAKTENKKNENQNESLEIDEGESKKKKQRKEKRKNYIKELGLQVLSKKEWKKLRNRYLDLQKKKMKEFKQYLYKQKFAKGNYEKQRNVDDNMELTEEAKQEEDTQAKLEYTPGVIVKLKLQEPCTDPKKLKNEIKSASSEIKYVDVPLPSGSDEVYIRFGDSQNAKDFCNQDSIGEKTILIDDEEKSYWEKIQNDRNIKFSKTKHKQRGRDKLLKKAEKERAKHIRFDEVE